jgi:hypothetical protein
VPNSQAMTFDQATARLLQLAKQNGGRVTAAQVEADERLSVDQNLTSAAARALAGGTNIFSFDEPNDGRAWFPFSGLVIGQLHADDI